MKRKRNPGAFPNIVSLHPGYPFTELARSFLRHNPHGISSLDRYTAERLTFYSCSCIARRELECGRSHVNNEIQSSVTINVLEGRHRLALTRQFNRRASECDGRKENGS